ncbi:MAG: hypothetical protein ABR497_13045, partial [Kiritimatiellia bacterium]
MFFREKKTSKHPVLQLVENQRNANGKVSQRVVVSLGGCFVPDEYRKAVAIDVTHRMAGYQRMLPLEDPIVADWAKLVLERIEEAGRLPDVSFREVRRKDQDHLEEICIDAVEHEEGVELGPCLVLLQAWAALDLDRFLSARGFSPDKISTAKVSVINRLIDPCSENELVNWVGTTALGDLLNVHTGAWGKDRFYRVSDKLLSARK